MYIITTYLNYEYIYKYKTLKYFVGTSLLYERIVPPVLVAGIH